MRGGVYSQPASSVVICRAAGVSSGNVYTTLYEAAAVAKRHGPGAILLIDGDVTADTSPIDIDGLIIEGFGGTTPILTVDEGTTFLAETYKCVTLKNLAISWTGDTPPFNVSSFIVVTMEEYVSFLAETSTTGAMFYSATGDVYVDVGYACSIKGSAGHPVIELSVGGGAVCELNIKATPPDIEGVAVTALAANSITGGDAGAYTITDTSAGLTAGGGAASISHSQSGTNAPLYRP